MKKSIFTFKKILLTGIAILALSSCTVVRNSMVEPNTRVDLTKSDFILSDQVTAQARTVKVFWIDWARIFDKRFGETRPATVQRISYIPVLGNIVRDQPSEYALYELMNNNPGYDVVFFPQFERKETRYTFIVRITDVKATARLGKLKQEDQ